MATHTIRKAALIQGRTLIFKNAEEEDAPFILSLRTDARKSQHLSQVSDDVEAQVSWLKKYSRSESEAYFIIQNLARQNLGTVRLYDAQADSFCWGSWILSDAAPTSAAIESSLMVYSYAITHLGFSRAHFQVNIGNERVWSFHERFGAIRVATDATQYHYELSCDAIARSMDRFHRYLPDGLNITEI